MIENRRKFIKKSAGLIAGSGIVAGFINSYSNKKASAKSEVLPKKKESDGEWLLICENV